MRKSTNVPYQASVQGREIYRVSPFLFFSKILIGLFCLLIAGGCVKNYATESLKKTDADNLKAIIDKVPFVSQKPNLCGPATLAMIFNFWGLNITQGEIAKDIYSPELKGTLSTRMLLYTLEKGFKAEMYQGNLKDLKEKIKAGIPLIVSNRYKKESEKVHYLVVWGFDDIQEMIHLHSGKKANETIDYQTFLKYWDWANNFTFLIYPKSKIISDNKTNIRK